MNTMLQQAQRQMAQLRRKKDESEPITVDYVLMFDRTEEEMKQLVGYHEFEKALQELGGQRTEENIQKACETSRLHPASIYRENKAPKEDVHIPIRCTRTQAKKLIYSNGNFEHKNHYLD